MAIIKFIKDKFLYILGGIAFILAVLVSLLRRKNIELETEALNNEMKVRDASLSEKQSQLDKKIEETKHKSLDTQDDKTAEEYWKKK